MRALRSIARATELGDYGHSHSWITLQELHEFDWDQKVPHAAVIDLADPRVREWFEKGDRSTAPRSYAHFVTSRNGISPDQFREVAWTQSLRIDVREFLEGALPYLDYVAEPGPQKTRIVFWFKD